MVIYHTGGGETAEVLADPGNEKRGILEALSSAGYLVTSITSTRDHWGSPISLGANDLLYEWASSEFRVGEVAILCQSMGGLSAYNWLCRNGEKVRGIYGIYPVTNLGSMLQGDLGEAIGKVYQGQGINVRDSLSIYDPIRQIVKTRVADIPAKHRHGDADLLVRYRENALDFAKAYRKSGGEMDLVTVKGLGHEANPAFFAPEEVVAFMDSLDW